MIQTPQNPDDALIQPISQQVDKQLKDIELQMKNKAQVSNVQGKVKNDYKSFSSSDQKLKDVFGKMGDAADKAKIDAEEDVKELKKTQAEFKKIQDDIKNRPQSSQSKETQVDSNMTNVRLEVRRILKNILY